jgi:hypothetical protein
MKHGGCCDCFVCKIGQSLGLMACDKKDCCKTATKKKKKIKSKK